METSNHLPHQDKLRALADKPMFSFLKNQDLGRIQYDLRKEEFPFGSVYVETLGSGATGKMNEDAPMILDMGEGRTLIAVLDAASSQKKNPSFDNEGVSGAFYVSHLISMGFETSMECEDLKNRVDLSAADVLLEMNSWLYKNMKDIPGVDYSDAASVPGMAAVLMLVDRTNNRISLAQVADATATLLKSDGRVEVLTPNLNARFDEKTAEYVSGLIRDYNSDLSHIRQIPDAKELIRIHLAESFVEKTNKKGGVGILNGMPELISNRLVYSTNIPLDDKVSSILLYSDGAILPYMEKDVSPDSAAEAFVKKVYGKTDVSTLLDGAKVLESDADFSRIPRMKMRDDATLVAVNFKNV